MRVRAITRGASGGDAVYLAALLGGRTLWNERTGELHKYGWRRGIQDAAIVLPQSLARDSRADWARDPYRLWNTAEFAENHPNARVARNYLVALPAPMTPGQRRDLVYGFAQDLADRYGCAVDIALQPPYGKARDHRAHLLATTREVGPNGLQSKTVCEPLGNTRTALQASSIYGDVQRDIRQLWEQHHAKALQRAHLPEQEYQPITRKFGQTHHLQIDARSQPTRQERAESAWKKERIETLRSKDFATRWDPSRGLATKAPPTPQALPAAPAPAKALAQLIAMARQAARRYFESRRSVQAPALPAKPKDRSAER